MNGMVSTFQTMNGMILTFQTMNEMVLIYQTRQDQSEAPEGRKDLGKTSIRKKTFQFGHCPNYPNPKFGQLYRLFPADKNDVLCVWRKNTDDDNNCCQNIFDQNFDDNYDKKY